MKSSFAAITCIFMLTLAGCGKKAQEENNQTPQVAAPTKAEIYFKAYQELDQAIEANDVEKVKEIVSNNPGINLNLTLNDGETYLIKAIKKNYIEIRNFLVEKNCELNKPSVSKNTPLITAVAFNRINSLQFLLDLNVKLDEKNNNGDTALHLAIKLNHEDMAILLINYGAGLDITDEKHRNAYRLTQEYRLNRAANLIRGLMQVEYGAPDISTFRNILSEGDYSTLKKVINRYPKIASDYESINPLMILVNNSNQNESFKMAELLLEYEVNVNGPSDAELTPLLAATIAQKVNFVRLFLNKKAKTQLLDKQGKSPLIHAVELNNLELVELLKNNSATQKYTYRMNGKRITYNACKIAKDRGQALTGEDKTMNLEILYRLKCGFFDGFF